MESVLSDDHHKLRLLARICTLTFVGRRFTFPTYGLADRITGLSGTVTKAYTYDKLDRLKTDATSTYNYIVAFTVTTPTAIA